MWSPQGLCLFVIFATACLAEDNVIEEIPNGNFTNNPNVTTGKETIIKGNITESKIEIVVNGKIDTDKASALEEPGNKFDYYENDNEIDAVAYDSNEDSLKFQPKKVYKESEAPNVNINEIDDGVHQEGYQKEEKAYVGKEDEVEAVEEKAIEEEEDEDDASEHQVLVLPPKPMGFPVKGDFPRPHAFTPPPPNVCSREEKAKCANGANCIASSVLIGGDAIQIISTCKCQWGFTGKYCQFQTNICHRMAVCAMGKCVPSSGGRYQPSFVCICYKGYTGKKCEKAVSPCDANPCANGSKCITRSMKGGRTKRSSWVIEQKSFFCKCVPGTYGKYCKYGYPVKGAVCQKNPCQNSGVCQPLARGEYVPMYQKPQWTKTRWLLNKMQQKRRALYDAAQQPWDGYQHSSRRAASAPGYRGRRPAYTSRHAALVDKVDLFPWFPRSFQKRRPSYRVDYKCQCAFGFTGYNCETNANFKELEMIRDGIAKVGAIAKFVQESFNSK